jgi:hypothetical protein
LRQLREENANLPRLLLALSSNNGKSNNNDKDNPRDERELIGSFYLGSLKVAAPEARVDSSGVLRDTPSLVRLSFWLAKLAIRNRRNRPAVGHALLEF